MSSGTSFCCIHASLTIENCNFCNNVSISVALLTTGLRLRAVELDSLMKSGYIFREWPLSGNREYVQSNHPDLSGRIPLLDPYDGWSAGLTGGGVRV